MAPWDGPTELQALTCLVSCPRWPILELGLPILPWSFNTKARGGGGGASSPLVSAVWDASREFAKEDLGRSGQRQGQARLVLTGPKQELVV